VAKRKKMEPSRLINNTGTRLLENSSFTRKYSEMMKSTRNRMKIKNFFINKRERLLPGQPFP
jgi:hypothetical protein